MPNISLIYLTDTFQYTLQPCYNNHLTQIMGNNSTCCKDNRGSLEYQRVDVLEVAKIPSNITSPQMQFNNELTTSFPPWLSAQLSQKKLFGAELQTNKQAQKHSINGDIFYGQLDEKSQPVGFGRIQKSDGSYYVGQFKEGQANGLGIYFLSENCYYQGEMVNNKAQSTHGYFKDSEIEYRGGFHNNEFHGLGKQNGSNYQFNGEYQNGKRKEGLLKWHERNGEEFSYKGKFDEKGKFTGFAKLLDPLGYYEGEFVSGQKEGYGIYRFKTEIRYEGYYKKNQKNGRGQIINKDGTIAFAGEFLNGVPHGKGYATDSKGKKHSLQWNEGVYADLI